MTTALLAHCQTAISSFKPSLTTVDAHVEDYLTVHKVRAASRVTLSLDGNDSAYSRTDAGATNLHRVGYRNERAAFYPANHVRMRALQEALQGVRSLHTVAATFVALSIHAAGGPIRLILQALW